MTMFIDDEKVEVTKQDANNVGDPSADRVWPPPPDNQEETAAKQSISSVGKKPNYLVAVLQGLGLNLVSFWFLLIVGNVFFPGKFGPIKPGNNTFFWICWGLAVAINTIAFAVVPKNKLYSAFLLLGVVLMSGVTWWFNCVLLDIYI